MEGALLKAASVLIGWAVQPFYDFFKASVEGTPSCLGSSATYISQSVIASANSAE